MAALLPCVPLLLPSYKVPLRTSLLLVLVVASLSAMALLVLRPVLLAVLALLRVKRRFFVEPWLLALAVLL